MVIYRERKTDPVLQEIGLLYSRLGLLFSDIAEAFVDWLAKKEGLLPEITTPKAEQVKKALVETKITLDRLKIVERKYKFDKRVLAELYRDEIDTCCIAANRMVTSLNIVWKSGKPSKREVPFGDSTNYKFIMKRLISYKDLANDTSKSINKKTDKFNKVNKDLPPLPRIPDNISAPSWAKNL